MLDDNHDLEPVLTCTSQVWELDSSDFSPAPCSVKGRLKCCSEG